MTIPDYETCPFCEEGGYPVRVTSAGKTKVTCLDCGAYGPPDDPNADKWNARRKDKK